MQSNKFNRSNVKIIDSVDQSDHAVEVDITFDDGSKRFCFFLTPDMINKFGDYVNGTKVRLHYGNNMIVVSELSEDIIFKCINQLDIDGVLLDHTTAT